MANTASSPAAARWRPDVDVRFICRIASSICVLVAALAIFSGSASTVRAEDGGWLLAFEQGEFDKAVALMRPAAEQGDMRAQYRLGLILDFGLGVPMDLTEAAHWYRQAAAQGNSEARIALGRLFERGGVAAAEGSVSAAWFRLTAQQPGAALKPELQLPGASEPANAASEFGNWLKGVSGQPLSGPPGVIAQVPDATIAIAVPELRDQARRGDVAAQLRLAGAYYGGAAGLAPDVVRAFLWYSLAVSSAVGEERRRALSYRQALERKMSVTQIREALDRVRDCHGPAVIACD